MFGGGDDDDDFTPVPSSKLASLFGIGNSSVKGNSSLTYTAPKQPKKSREVDTPDLSSPNPTTAASTHKLSMIYVQVVHTFKLDGNEYNPQGKLGAAILGNVESRVFQLLLYKGKKAHITSARITPQFQYTVNHNSYSTFYDDSQQNWSMKFDNSQDAVQFAREVTLARAKATSNLESEVPLIQDLQLGDETPGVGVGAQLKLRYSVRSLDDNQLGEVFDSNLNLEQPMKVKVTKESWGETLIGISKGAKRIIVLPANYLSPWKAEIPSSARLVLQVDCESVRHKSSSRDGTPNRLPSLHDSGDSALDSSNEDTSIKARGASISEALTNSPKTHKASLINRMARMGQATLPLKGAVACNPSDSEETEEESGTPLPATKPTVKPRGAKPRPQAHSSTMPEPPIEVVGQVVPQQMSVYHQVSWQQQQQQQFMRNGSMPYVPAQYSAVEGQMISVLPPQQVFPTASTPTLPSPDTHLAIFLSENRTHNSELRMGVTKVADKVDQVLSKLDNLNLHQHNALMPASSGTLEPATLLSSIQKLVSENEQLRSELTQKRSLLEQHGDKMYQLLQANQTYMLQNTAMMEKSRDLPSQVDMVALQQNNTRLTTDLANALARINSLQGQVEIYQTEGSQVTDTMTSLEAKYNAIQETLKQTLKDLQEKDKIIHDLELELEEAKSTNHAFKRDMLKIEGSLVEIESSKEQAEVRFRDSIQKFEEERNKLIGTHQAELTELQKQVIEQKPGGDENEQKIEGMAKGLVENLLVDKARLEAKIQQLQNQATTDSDELVDNSSAIVDEVKKVMNVMYRNLEAEFEPGLNYEGTDIKNTLMTTIRVVALQYLEKRGRIEFREVEGHKTATLCQPPKTRQSSNSEEKVDTGTTLSQPAPEVEDRKENPEQQQDVTAEGQNEMQSGKAEEVLAADNVIVVGAEELSPGVEQSKPVTTEGTVPENAPPSAGDVSQEAGLKVQATEKSSRDSSLERSWRPQPPPPPLFDDEDDDDEWLQ